MTRPLPDRLARALDRVQAGGSAGLRGHSWPGAAGEWADPSAAGDRELQELLETAGYLRESLVRVPAPGAFREELGDWLAQPRRGPWWRELMGPFRGRVPRAALSRPAVGAALGLAGAAAIAVGVVVLRRRLVPSATS